MAKLAALAHFLAKDCKARRHGSSRSMWRMRSSAGYASPSSKSPSATKAEGLFYALLPDAFAAASA